MIVSIQNMFSFILGISANRVMSALVQSFPVVSACWITLQSALILTYLVWNMIWAVKFVDYLQLIRMCRQVWELPLSFSISSFLNLQRMYDGLSKSVSPKSPFTFSFLYVWAMFFQVISLFSQLFPVYYSMHIAAFLFISITVLLSSKNFNGSSQYICFLCHYFLFYYPLYFSGVPIQFFIF